jgi:hypothetical protein
MLGVICFHAIFLTNTSSHMFATLSSFLPSALQNSPNPTNGTNKEAPIVNAEEQPSRLVGVDEVGVKKKERRTNNEVRL